MPRAAAAPPQEVDRTTIIKDKIPSPAPMLIPEMAPPQSNDAGPAEGTDLFDYLRTIKPNDWQEYMVYLYWSPPGIRKLGPYIDVITEPVSMEWVRQKFGGSNGGRFTLWVNHLEDPTWRRTQEFEIEGSRKMADGAAALTPAVPNPAGQSSVLEKLLERLLEKLDNGGGQVQEAAKGSLEIMKKGFEGTLEAISRQAGGSDQNSLVNTIRALKELGLVGQPQQNTLIDTIKTLKEFGLIGAPTATDPLKQVETFGKLVEAVSALRPEQGGDFKTELLKGVVNGLPTIRAMTADLARAAEWNAKANQVSQGAPASTRTVQPTNPKADSTAPASTPPAVSPNPAPAEAAPGAPEQPVEVDVTPFIWSRVIDMIRHDCAGDEIADWIAKASPLMFAQLGQFEPGGLQAMLENNPEMKAALAGKDAPKLCADFCHYAKTGEFVDDEDEDEEEESPDTSDLPTAGKKVQ